VTPSIGLSQWFRFIDEEYLRGFVRDGGSAIKFAVPLDDAFRAEIFDGLSGLAAQAGYLVVKISAAETKIHLMDEVFFRTAEQVPWHILSRRFIAKLAADAGYEWTEDGDGPLYARLAGKNRVDPQMLLLDLKKAIGNVLKEPALSRDFRVAMAQLCIAELSGGQDGLTAVKVLTDWLTGHNRAVSAVKPYHIFRKINRSTARFFFQSMVRWTRLNAYPGIVLLLDAQRLMLAHKPEDPNSPYYSKAAVLDAYELLRQFIDGADNLEGFFMVVVPDFDFLEDPNRGIGAYEALKFRVFDEIHDRNLANPMASLGRISAAS